MTALVELPDELVDAHARAWRRLASAGTWWRGADRVAIAAEVRAARSCELCARRKAALSPYAVDGHHDAAGTELAAAVIDTVHRIATDPGRLTESRVNGIVGPVIDAGPYVELVSVVAEVTAVDRCLLALDLDLLALPEPEVGEPRRVIPDDVVDGWAWVPTTGTSSVLDALSLVPDEVAALRDLSDAQYLSLSQMADLAIERDLGRAQIELVAARTSVVNECFY